MLVAAAVCPHPPLLVPDLAAGAAAELDGLRAACDAALASLLTADADLLVVVGDGPVTGPLPSVAWGSLASYGVDIVVGTPEGPPDPAALADHRTLAARPAGVRSGGPGAASG